MTPPKKKERKHNKVIFKKKTCTFHYTQYINNYKKKHKTKTKSKNILFT